MGAQLLFANMGYAHREMPWPMMILVWFLVAIVLAAQWQTFKKAGRPGWAAIIPFYNAYILIKIAGRPGWWVIAYLVPLLNIIVHIVVVMDVAKSFGKSNAFGIFWLWLFPFIGFYILGFGEAKYKGVPKHE